MIKGLVRNYKYYIKQKGYSKNKYIQEIYKLVIKIIVLGIFL